MNFDNREIKNNLNKINFLKKTQEFEVLGLLHEKINSKNFIDLRINNIIQNLSKNSNILQPVVSVPELDRARPDVYVLDSKTGRVLNPENPDHSAPGFYEFASRYQIGTYFPILIDLSKPDTLTFGVGDQARFASGLPAEKTLIRNGGHLQLLNSHNRQSSTDGIYGGGVYLTAEGRLEIEFKSRGLNSSQGGDSTGHLSDEQEQALRQIVQAILARAEESARAFQPEQDLAAATF